MIPKLIRHNSTDYLLVKCKVSKGKTTDDKANPVQSKTIHEHENLHFIDLKTG